MNTPETEWEKGIYQLLANTFRNGNHYDYVDWINADTVVIDGSYDLEELADGIQQLLSSRDTYWKDRVRKTVGKIEESARTQDTSYEYGEGTYEGMMHSIFILKDITNEDNLK